MNLRSLAILAASLGLIAPAAAFGQRSASEPSEVRQLVTFRFVDRVPFGARPNMDSLLDLYRQTHAVVRMRGYREAESPEPFDLMLMTSFRGLEGFDQANKQLVGQRTREGRTIQFVYQELDQASEWHRDEFIEMLERHSYRTTADPRVFVFEWVRLVPAAGRAYELLLETTVLPWERTLTYLNHSETGRVIIGENWDYVRILGFPALADYQEYLADWRERDEAEQLALHIANRKVQVVREDQALRIR